MNKRPDITEKTRKNICDAFWEMHLSAPINKVYVSDIVEKANINRATFYRYYHDVYEIREEKETELINYFKEQLRNFSTIPSHKRIAVILHEISNFYKQQEKYMSILLGEFGDTAFSHILSEQLAELLMDNFSEHEISSEQQLIIAFARGGIIGIIQEWITSKGSVSAEKMCAISLNIINNGILPEFQKI
ncbi:MAG: TetR/AcrR family transcriptional regulator [Acetobacter sp.]|nr:TetR/AcrR family transcriptional regulator [Bacteroides sp.]MCM1340774.1 TetR/AcrR family transcriptional regulator [Acetobacter sp.]MCM1432669.1 TetR/AcrR family transcriptional regulator [Clostridiales bacterium]